MQADQARRQANAIRRVTIHSADTPGYRKLAKLRHASKHLLQSTVSANSRNCDTHPHTTSQCKFFSWKHKNSRIFLRRIAEFLKPDREIAEANPQCGFTQFAKLLKRIRGIACQHLDGLNPIYLAGITQHELFQSGFRRRAGPCDDSV